MTIILIIIAIIILIKFGIKYQEKQKQKELLIQLREQQEIEIINEENKKIEREKREVIWFDAAKEKSQYALEELNLKYGTSDTYEFDIAGVFYRSEKAKEAVKYINCGEEVKLKLDPYNEHDVTAVKVMYNRMHIGFAPSNYSYSVTSQINRYKDHIAFVVMNYCKYNEKYSDYESIITVKIYPDKNISKINQK